MNITYEFLKEEPSACVTHRRRFAQVFRKGKFPDGVEPTLKNYRYAESKGLDVSWLIAVKFTDLYDNWRKAERDIRYNWQSKLAQIPWNHSEKFQACYEERQAAYEQVLINLLDAIKALPQPTIE